MTDRLRRSGLRRGGERVRTLPAVLVLLSVLVPLATSCRDSGSRQRARAELVQQLVEGGLGRAVADCVVDGFFDVRNDGELREFFARDELTDAERREFALLGEACSSG